MMTATDDELIDIQLDVYETEQTEIKSTRTEILIEYLKNKYVFWILQVVLFLVNIGILTGVFLCGLICIRINNQSSCPNTSVSYTLFITGLLLSVILMICQIFYIFIMMRKYKIIII
jgi:hypothetical protein